MESTPPSRHLLINWIKKGDLTICSLFMDGKKHLLRMKGCKKMYQANGPPKQTGVVILISEKVNFKLMLAKRDKEGHFILIKGAIHQEKITVINLYAPNFIKYTLKDLKSHIDPNTEVVGNFNIPLSPIDRLSRQKSTKIS
jgi:hypothetical protein